MEWDCLYQMQKDLDKYIENNQSLGGREVFEEKCLALMVEVGELANETRCFKFWSKKPRNNHYRILEEYVDGIHFILSLGLEKGYQYSSREVKNPDRSETAQFNKVFQACTSFHQHPAQEEYEQLFASYLQLGSVLGFKEEEVQQAYIKKNEVNYVRQEEGY
ncbi:dUTP diphosphatase [Virgibacillus sediminis]|uniref:dUTP diphosphatase n=1 Tax=Virgibacillus sediminis TaxID=202260 RepID=A0ABV7A6G8_9BACI